MNTELIHFLFNQVNKKIKGELEKIFSFLTISLFIINGEYQLVLINK